MSLLRRHHLLGVLLIAGAAAAAGRAKRTTVTSPNDGTVAQRLEEQRQLFLRVLEDERDHLDLVIRMMRTNDARASEERSGTSAPPQPGGSSDSETTAVGSGPRAVLRVAPVSTGSVSGTVSVQGGNAAETFVFVQGLRDKQAHKGRAEVKQVNKQFVPRVSAVARGTLLSFPNLDSVFHNVFSVSPGNTFDLGSYRAGDKPGQATLDTPGVVQVFCNLHSQMSATVLVVPNSMFARVHADGTFKLDNVPLGRRKIAAWTPGAAAPVEGEVEVLADGSARLELALSAHVAGAHTNKFGQPYGSYQE